MGHTHSPFHLVARLQGPVREAEKVLETMAGCCACSEARETLAAWSEHLGHGDPQVAMEFVTRYEALAALLGSHESREERLARVSRDELFHGWGLCRLLLEEARKCQGFPQLSYALAELGYAVSGQLDEDFYGRSEVGELRTQAEFELGEAALRIVEQAQRS